ncbi:unnamed protein product [Caenorhabditis auriculariae]|uniref:G protein-coupled receptor n=1 Tax=Caenorhabditis auriculariae TaxID=2777116 RepID=A0A8S1H8I8_9PELO|nr:unnamed protein product [Caenorhabditis auriculariae]
MAFHTTVSLAGCLLNLLLIYLAYFHSPRTIRTYSILIINFALTDFGACFFDAFVEQRIVPTGWTLAYMSSGICRLVPSSCYISYSIMLHFYAHGLWSLLVSFAYRYYILVNTSPSGRTVIIILVMFYVPSFFQWISFIWALDPPEKITPILKERFPTYDLSDSVISGTVDIRSFSALFTILHMTLPALTCQACFPSFFLLAVLCYAVGQLGIYQHPVLEYVPFSVVLFIPLLSPCASLFFVKPYRLQIEKFLGVKSAYTEKTIRLSTFQLTKASRIDSHLDPRSITINF